MNQYLRNPDIVEILSEKIKKVIVVGIWYPGFTVFEKYGLACMGKETGSRSCTSLKTFYIALILEEINMKKEKISGYVLIIYNGYSRVVSKELSSVVKLI